MFCRVLEADCDKKFTERDSRKDEAVVFIFIFATSGLLTWAALRPWVGKWIEVCTRFLFHFPRTKAIQAVF